MPVALTRVMHVAILNKSSVAWATDNGHRRIIWKSRSTELPSVIRRLTSP